MMSDKAKVEIVFAIAALLACTGMFGFLYLDGRSSAAVQLECVKHGHTVKECQP